MLHITNGDCAVDALVRAGIPRENILAWRDVLHEGPVPADLVLEALSGVRAQFLAQCGCGEYDALRESFAGRDLRLAASQAEDEVVLWFESDLYDQLQLLQLLDWFADRARRPALLSRIEVDRSPSDGRFEGLGSVQPSRVHALLTSRRSVEQAVLQKAAAAWAAFRASSPDAVVDLLSSSSAQPDRARHDAHPDIVDEGLPYLHDALRRLLDELPHPVDGLGRTERLALRALAGDGPQRGCRLFARVQAAEVRPFLGDTWFWRMLDRLASGSLPLLERATAGDAPDMATDEAAWALTDAGREVFAGRRDAIQAIGIDRWWGGTRLRHGASMWRWDGAHLRADAAGGDHRSAP